MEFVCPGGPAYYQGHGAAASRKVKSRFMKQVKQLLVEGHAQASRERFASLIAQHPEKARPAADLMLKILEDCCDRGLAAPVNEWLHGVESSLPTSIAEPILRAMRARMRVAQEWAVELEGVTRERLARECRRGVTLRQYDVAASAADRLLNRSRSEEELNQRAQSLAHALSDLRQDIEDARSVINLISRQKGEWSVKGAQLLGSYYLQAVRSRVDMDYDRGDIAWTRQLTEAILRLRDALPDDNETGEPSDEQFLNFYVQARAILTAGLSRGRMDDLIDALQILIDFCPIDEASIKNAAGVEERMFVRLGPRARLTCVRVMRQVGRLDAMREAVLGLADAPEGQDRLKLLAGIMGGMGHADFFPWLERRLRKASDKQEEAWLLDAVSRQESPDAGDVLLERLSQLTRNLGQRDGLARARQTLVALGRFTRQRGLEVQTRNHVIRRAAELTDRSDRELSAQAAVMLFSNRPDELDKKLREWAARKCVEVMWTPPSSVQAQVAGGPNGWRQPMVATLKRLGADVLPEILHAAGKFKTRYSGAMEALGNVLEDVGDASAIPLMQSMIQCAMTHEEEDTAARSSLLKEKVLDVATGQTRDLDQDDLVHGMLVSLLKFGDEEGAQTVLEYADQVQAGVLTTPGPKTTAILFDVKLKHGKIGAVSTSRGPARPQLDDKAIRGLIAETRAGFFARKEKRIAAMAQLGHARALDAVSTLVENLGDKDVLVASAAHTALGQFMSPPPSEAEFQAFWDAVLERPKIIKGPILERLVDFIRRHVPKNPPYGSIYEQQINATIDDGALLHCLLGAIERPRAAKPKEPSFELLAEDESSTSSGQTTSGGRTTANGYTTDVDAPTPPTGPRKPGAAPQGAKSSLDVRRDYMMARKAWIEGGKKGPPPPPPPV